jgi:hypothetical protein
MKVVRLFFPLCVTAARAARDLKFDDKFTLSYLVDATAGTKAFQVKAQFKCWVAFGSGNRMYDGIDAFILQNTTSGWTVHNA